MRKSAIRPPPKNKKAALPAARPAIPFTVRSVALANQRERLLREQQEKIDRERQEALARERELARFD